MKKTKFQVTALRGNLLDNLQLSGTENVWLYDDGEIEFFSEDISIRYPAEFAFQILAFLRANEDTLVTKSFGNPKII